MSIEDLVSGWREMEAALPRYHVAERYYDGSVDEPFASARIRALVASTGLRYRFNLAKTAVNVMADRVELAAVTAPDNERASQVIEDIWDANDLDVHYPDLFRQVFEYGDSYVMVWPIEDDADDTTDDELAVVGVELTTLNPKNTRVFYDQEHHRRKRYAMQRWCLKDATGAERWRVDLWYADVHERWISRPNAAVDQPEGWITYVGDDEEPEEYQSGNPFGEIPIIHHRNDLPYGTPEHFAGYGCQDAVNKMLITQINTADSHGWPQRYALTEKGAELDQAGDGPDWDDDVDGPTSSTQGGTSSSVRTGPGTILTMNGTRATGQYDAADPGVFLEPTEMYIRLMAQLTTTPLHYFDPSGDVPSGESLRTAEAPLVKKVQRREAMLRGAIVETWMLALRMLNVVVERLDVRWTAVQSADGVADWEAVAAKQAAGVPQMQTLVEAGYEQEQVATWLDQEADAMDLTRRVALLDQLAEAATKLGAAVGAGVLSPEEATRVISAVVPQVAPPPGTEDGAA